MSATRLAGGYLRVLRVRGIVLRLHLTAPLGPAVLGRFEVRPGVWLGWTLLLVAHELGHALLMRRFGLTVTEIDLHALGGVCRGRGATTARRHVIIAWGGVLGQAAIGLPTVAIALSVPGPIPPGFAFDLVAMLIAYNAFTAVFNLVPIRPLDGATAWRLFARPSIAPPAKPPPPAPPPRNAIEELVAVEAIDRAPPIETPEVRAILDGLKRR